ncbi:MAG: Rrf2 family transcriptional regulator [Acidimicrobiia bacterium]
MRISAKADYAVRALLELAAAPAGSSRSARELAEAQGIPQNFLENILSELRRAGLVRTHRGPTGGSSLARGADAITLADILRAVDGPLAAVRDLPPESLDYPGAACRLPAVWCSVGDSLGRMLGQLTVADLVDLPAASRAGVSG